MVMGVSQHRGYHFGGPHNKDYIILGSILGSPYLGKLPYLQCLHGTLNPKLHVKPASMSMWNNGLFDHVLGFLSHRLTYVWDVARA